jgi:phenylpropionate dioxygenase-like ring-hydroxylating dioxygenase large terminal subunit|tara:strand:+ start:75 stop:1088 length:1014 start_codon:yes stop_codon:yes gene_type:complete
MLIQNHWYPVCPSERLKSDKPVSAQIGKYALVAFRDRVGKPVVMLDRCPHRGVPLSLGRVHDGKIACRYHGWQIAADGALVGVPAHPDEAVPNCSVPTFEAVESSHYLWAWISDTGVRPSYQPALRGIQHGEWHQYTCVWQVNIIAAVENNLDASHVPFSHADTYPLRGDGTDEVPDMVFNDLRCEVDHQSVVVWGPGRKQRPPPDFETTASMGMRFELPFRNYVWAAGRTARAIYNWVPLDNESCRLEFMVQQGAEPSGPVSIVLRDGEPYVPSQDRVLLEAAQRLNWVEGDEKPYFKSVPSDQPAHFARNIMKRALRGDGLSAQAPKQFNVSCWG